VLDNGECELVVVSCCSFFGVDCGRRFIGDFISQNSSCDDGDGDKHPTDNESVLA
jgi:hypothetical protein